MPSLIINGNLNQFTFANSIVCGNDKAKSLFNEPLDQIFIIHSYESKKALDNSVDWITYLHSKQISSELFHHKIIDLDSNEGAVQRLIHYFDFIINGLKTTDCLIIDLTNGTSAQKNLLSVIAYALNIKNQYVIDIQELSKITKDRGFIDNYALMQAYKKAPDSSNVDCITYLGFSEMVRYGDIIKKLSNKYSAINPHKDVTLFQENLKSSIKIKHAADNLDNNAHHRISAASIATSIDDLIGQFLDSIKVQSKGLTLGAKIKAIRANVIENAGDEFDLAFFDDFNSLLLRLRNSTTHMDKSLSTIEKFKADLSLKIVFPFIEYYTDVVYPLLNCIEHKPIIGIKILSASELHSDTTWYYGLDGDDTGKKLEELFLNSTVENSFSEFSKLVSKATDNIATNIKKESNLKGPIIFNAGDDLLFKGSFTFAELEKFQEQYKGETKGHTCSIGFGKTFQEVYIALKIAKSQPGKEAIVGIEIESSKTFL